MAAPKKKRTYADMTIADKLLLKNRLKLMLYNLYYYKGMCCKITKYDINGNITTVYSDHPASPHVYATAEFPQWIGDFTVCKVERKKMGDIKYNQSIIKPVGYDFEEDRDGDDDEYTADYYEPGEYEDIDDISDVHRMEEEDGVLISQSRSTPTMADVVPGKLKNNAVKKVEPADLPTVDEESKSNEPQVAEVAIKKVVDDDIEDVLPIFDVCVFDNLSAELMTMMTNMMMAKEVTSEMIQKATMVNALASTIVKIHTDKVGCAVQLAKNADALTKMLNPQKQIK
jgi:hypothetical protein